MSHPNPEFMPTEASADLLARGLQEDPRDAMEAYWRQWQHKQERVTPRPWVCPVCGAGVAPFVTVCPICSPKVERFQVVCLHEPHGHGQGESNGRRDIRLGEAE